MSRLRMPPSEITGALGDYLQDLWRYVESQPQFSTFSGTTPNGAVLGYPGDMTINLGSASTDTRAWIKGGATRTWGNTNWVTLRIGPA